MPVLYRGCTVPKGLLSCSRETTTGHKPRQIQSLAFPLQFLFCVILPSNSGHQIRFILWVTRSILFYLIMCMLHAHIFFIDLLAIITSGKILNYRIYRLPHPTTSLEVQVFFLSAVA